jgi:hypothetical protein
MEGTSMEAPKFAIGDRVAWVSQAGGNYKEKHGEIVEIVPAGQMPKTMPRLETVLPRRSTSYVVEVKTGKSSTTQYWPRTKGLTKN